MPAGPIGCGELTLECWEPQVHADASNFASGITKQQAYEHVLLQAEGLLDGQRNWVSPCL